MIHNNQTVKIGCARVVTRANGEVEDLGYSETSYKTSVFSLILEWFRGIFR